MNRRDFIRTSSAFLAASCIPGIIPSKTVTAKPHQTDKPNFVFIFADDLGWGDLNCYGNPRIQSPYLNQLAKEGRLFTQFYVNAPVCSPSRVGFMTGKFPATMDIHGAIAGHEHNVENGMPDWLDPKYMTITRLLQQNGYRTGHYGKWHLSHPYIKDAPTPNDYGFDEYKIASREWGIFAIDNRPVSTKMVLDEAWGFIERNKENPFYVQAWLADTHSTLNPSEEQMQRYDGIWWAETGTEHKSANKIYMATVTEMDRQIGIFLSKLKAAGLYDNTVVIFSSDNGPEDIYIGEASHSGVGSPGPFRGRKRSIYEGGVRVPFIIRWPGHTQPGSVDNDSLISGVDYLPTIASLAGIDTSKLEIDGEDASVIFENKPFTRKKPLFWEYRYQLLGHPINNPPLMAIRDKNFKLLMNPDKSRIELYDIPNDLSEVDNVADNNPQVVAALSEKLLKWHKGLPDAPIHPSAGKNQWPIPTSK